MNIMSGRFNPPKSWEEVPVVIDLVYVANVFRMSYEHIKKLAREGKLPAFKLGDSWYMQKQDLIGYIEQKKKVKL